MAHADISLAQPEKYSRMCPPILGIMLMKTFLRELRQRAGVVVILAAMAMLIAIASGWTERLGGLDRVASILVVGALIVVGVIFRGRS